VLRALGIEGGPPWAPLLDCGPDDRPIPVQLHEIGHELAKFFDYMVPRITALKALGLFAHMHRRGEKPPPLVGFEALTRWFERVIRAGRIQPHDAEALATSFLGSFQARAFWMHIANGHLPQPLPDREAWVTSVVALFWNGVEPKETS
jgi:hypothetical protein